MFREPAGKLKAAAGPSKGFNDEMAEAFRSLADQTEASGAPSLPMKPPGRVRLDS